jgi:hypothetical protein
MSGRIAERDKQGKITKGHLTAEQASEMGKKRWNKERIEEIEALLGEFGYTQETAPAHLRLLAQKASVSGSGSVTALVQLIRALRESRSFDEGMKVRLRPGDLCPCCQQYYQVELSRELIEMILEMTGGPVLDADVMRIGVE